MSDCIFCMIAKGEIPSTCVYQDEKVFAFKDINPAAPIHIILIPKEHIESALSINKGNSSIIAYLFEAAAKIASDLGIAEDGYRIVTNIGKNGGQTVKHLHFHILGGRNLQWPPG